MEKLEVCPELACFSKSISVVLVLSHVIISLSPSFLSVSLIWSLSLTLCTYAASAVSRQGQSAPRTGFFHFFKRQEVFIQGVVNYIPLVDAFVTETRMESSDKHIFQGPTKGSTWLPHSKINDTKQTWLPFFALWTTASCFNRQHNYKWLTCTFAIVHC